MAKKKKKKWKKNESQDKYKVKGTPSFHQETGARVGTIYPGGSEILSDVVVKASEESEEVTELLEDL